MKTRSWTNDELFVLVKEWKAGTPLDAIAPKLKSTRYAVLSLVKRLRKSGVPLSKRKRGREKGAASTHWDQKEVDRLIRRRREGATDEQISKELRKSVGAVCAKILRLRHGGAPIEARRNGQRRLWDVGALKAACAEPASKRGAVCHTRRR